MKPRSTTWSRFSIALVSVLGVAVLAWGVATLGGPSSGAVPTTPNQLDVLTAAEPAVWAVVVVRLAALALALRWLALMGAAWLAMLRGRHTRAERIAGKLPAPLRLAVSLSLSPVLITLPAVAGAQQQPPSGVPTTVATIEPTQSDSTGVLQLTPMPAGPESNQPDPRAPTAGTTPAPVLPPAGVNRQPVEGQPGVEDASCPTIVTRSGVHWFDQARAYLDDQLGHPASDDEAELYWQRCVVHNADRFIDPDEPDVVAPGQPLELPELPRTL